MKLDMLGSRCDGTSELNQIERYLANRYHAIPTWSLARGAVGSVLTSWLPLLSVFTSYIRASSAFASDIGLAKVCFAVVAARTQIWRAIENCKSGIEGLINDATTIYSYHFELNWGEYYVSHSGS